SLQQGLRLYRLRVVLELLTIDEELENLKARAKPLGEIITYLPTGQGADADSIELDILMVSSAAIEQLRDELGTSGVDISELPRRSKSPAAAPKRESSSQLALVTDSLPPADGALTPAPTPLKREALAA